jgi:hypothetical protein
MATTLVRAGDRGEREKTHSHTRIRENHVDEKIFKMEKRLLCEMLANQNGSTPSARSSRNQRE